MIAKLVPMESRKSDFAKLARYVVDAKGRPDPGSWTRTADYILDTVQGGAKVSGVRITNCRNEEPAAAVIEILNHQTRNRRSTSIKTLHLVISFPPGERPDQAQLHHIEDQLCAEMRLASHQRISAVHTDTEHLHVHVAINKVHPNTLRNITPYYPQYKLMEACERLEIELGLKRTEHGRPRHADRTASNSQSSKPSRATDMEAHASRDSLFAWIEANAKRDILSAARTAADWQTLHQAFAAYDLQLRERGAGLVVWNEAHQISIKASDIDRSLSMKKLTERLGTFVAAGSDILKTKPNARYTAVPRATGSEDDGLFARYQTARQQAQDARKASRTDLYAAHREYRRELEGWYAERRKVLKNRREIRGLEKRQAYAELRAKRIDDLRTASTHARQQAQGIAAKFALQTWLEFLQQAAEQGDARAVHALRAGRPKSDCPYDPKKHGTLSSPKAKTIILNSHRPQVRRNGDVEYKVADGAVVTDRSADIGVDRASRVAVCFALELAQAKYLGQTLTVRGSVAFKIALVEAAVECGSVIMFTDPGMEQARVAGLARSQSLKKMPPLIEQRAEHQIRQRIRVQTRSR